MSVLSGSIDVDLLQGTAPIYWVFQGTVQIWFREVVVVLSSGTNVDLKSRFTEAQWSDVNLAKRVVVPTGVEIGGTTTAYAIRSGATSQADSWAGVLKLEIRGTVSGIGGAVNSGVGGNVISVPFPGRNGEKLLLEIINGLLRAGGGGGGRAGNGGPGVWYSGRTVNEGPYYSGATNQAPVYGWVSYYATAYAHWGSTSPIGTQHDVTSMVIGGVTYTRGALTAQHGDDDGGTYYHYMISRTYTAYDVPNYTSGGVAANAGKGQGFDGAATAGGAPVAGGGSGAGASGKSGDGGPYGSSGQAGANGAPGTAGAGTAGVAAGLAGYYLLGTANVTLTNTGGTLLGRLG